MGEKQKDMPLIIAHRGAAGDAPENTLAAFQLAVDQGCDAIELDVHLSADHQLVVIHDDLLDRTTNGTGKVSEMTVSQLKALDAGSWFDEKFKGQQIPLLAEVFEVIPPEMMVNIEIKNVPAYYKNIEQVLSDFLIKVNRVEQVIVSSFDHHCLVRIKQINHKLKIGLLYAADLVRPELYTKLLGVPVHSLHPNVEVVRKEDVATITAAGLMMYPWTVDDMKQMKKMIDCHVSGIITNHPNKLMQLIMKMEK